MSTSLATTIAMALYVIALAPVAAAFWKPRLIVPLLWFFGVPMLGLATYQAGPFLGDRPMNVPGGQLQPGDASNRRCGEIISLLERERMILNRSDPAHLVVARELWEQLPEQARDAVVECIERARPAGANPVEVVQQPAG